MTVAVLLENPKFPHNVGAALRACYLLGARDLYWTGDRVPAPADWPPGSRLPREERLRLYGRVKLTHVTAQEARGLRAWYAPAPTPLCVELSPTAMDLRQMARHPDHAIYVFGPEDGSVSRGLRAACHQFLRIPTAEPGERTPYNLAAAVHLVLFHRLLMNGGL